MAKNSDLVVTTSALSRIGTSARRWASSFLSPAREITQTSGLMYGGSPITVASLLQSGRRGARIRREIYQKWSYMEGDAIVSSAMSLLVTSALGGNEATGDIVFIETKADARGDKARAKMVSEISRDLSRLLNRVAYPTAYVGAVYGDAYARIYTDKRGVVELYTDELVRPQLVQPYERGSRTVGYAVYTGERSFQRLDVSQMARMKLPRTQWVPQQGVVEKSMKLALEQDDIDELPIMPSMAGGSLLFPAEEAYDNLNASLLGLVGQRWMDSIDEQMLQVNLSEMTEEQQDRFITSIGNMLSASKKRAEDAVKSGRPVMERIRHIIPVFGEKQLTTVSNSNGGGTGRTATISIEDVMMHARLLAGALGVDLSMLGFSDQMAGGLGEGGWFRTSAQAAERARIIRVALEDFLNQIIDIHTLNRYGVVFDPADRPWEIQFYGSVSALESERQKTRNDAMTAGLMLAQGIQQMRDMGADKRIMELFLTKVMLVDEEEAKVFAKIVDLMPKQPGGGDEFGGGGPGSGGGGGGGGFGGGEDDPAGEASEDDEDKGEGEALDDAGPDLAEVLLGMFPSVAFDSADATGIGPEFRGYKGDPAGAISRLMRERRGHVNAVVKRPGIGEIALLYGDERGGLRHISEKHPEQIARLAHVLKNGKVLRLPGDSRKAFLFLEGSPADVTVIALDYMGRKKAWVVTSYGDVRGSASEKLRKVGVGVTGATVDTADSGAADETRRGNANPRAASVPPGKHSVHKGRGR